MRNMFKSYKCTFCGFKKEYISGPFLSDERNIIAANCPECGFGSMVINFDEETNFNDNYIEKYYDSMLAILGEGGLDGLV